MNNEISKKLIIIEYLNDKIDTLLQEEPLTYCSQMQYAKQEHESELEWLKKNNSEYKDFIANASGTLENINGFTQEIKTLLCELEEKYGK